MQTVAALVTMLGLVLKTDVRELLPSKWLEDVSDFVSAQVQRAANVIKPSAHLSISAPEHLSTRIFANFFLSPDRQHCYSGGFIVTTHCELSKLLSCATGEVLVTTPQAASSATPVLGPEQQHGGQHGTVQADFQEELSAQVAHAPAYSITGDQDLSTIMPGRYNVFGGRSIVPQRETRASRRRA